MPAPSYILRKHEEDVTCIKFLDTNDDQVDILSSGDVTGNVKIWSLETRRAIHEFRPVKDECSIPNIEYHSNTNTFLTQTRSPSHGWIHAFDIKKLNKAIFKFDTHCCSFCRFNIVSPLKNTQIFDNVKVKQTIENNKEEKEEKNQNDEQSNELNLNESLLSKMLKKQAKNKECKKDNNNNNIVSSNMDTSHMLIASAGFQRGLLQIWDCHNHKIINKFDFDEIPNDDNKRGMIMAINAFYTNKRNNILCVIVSESGFIDVYDVGASKILFSQKFGENTPLTCMALNNKRNCGICAGANNILYGFSIKYNLNQMKIKKEIKLKNDGANVVKIRNYDEKIFGFGGWDHRTRIYNWKTFQPLCILKGHKGGITDLDFHPYKNLLATSAKDAHIAVYELY